MSSALRGIRSTCVPRPDVLAGGMSDNQFAAQLDRIVRDPSGYEAYGDPDRFFDLTYPTTGLKQLLAKTFGRLTGAPGDDGDNGVLRAETSFGGGKTHSLMAVYHLAKGARPTGLGDFLAPNLLPDGPVNVVAVVGDALDPVNGLTTNGLTSHTLWGEIGDQQYLGVGSVCHLEALVELAGADHPCLVDHDGGTGGHVPGREQAG